MSKKSRARSDTRQSGKQTPHCLHLQQEAARQGAWNTSIFALIIILSVIAVLIIGGTSEGDGRKALWGLLVQIPIGAVYTVQAIRRHRLNRMVRRIQSNDAYDIRIRCTKVRFMTKRITKYTSVIYAMEVFNENGNAFFYIFPIGDERSDYATNDLRKSLVGRELSLTCYADTHIVKSFPNNTIPKGD